MSEIDVMQGFEFPEELENRLRELNAEPDCEPCDGELCEYRDFCRCLRVLYG